MTLSRLTTESRNPASERIDSLSPLEIVRLMNAEDATVAEAVGREAAAIARAIEIVVATAGGGRTADLPRAPALPAAWGCSTRPSARPPSTARRGRCWASSPAGRPRCNAASRAPRIRGKRPSRTSAKSISSANDVVFGIATSGRTPYVLGGLEYARQIGAATRGPELQPRGSLQRHGRRDDHADRRPGGHYRFDPLEGRHGDQDGPQHGQHRRDGPAGQDLRQPDGRSAGDEQQAGRSLAADRGRADRPLGA